MLGDCVGERLKLEVALRYGSCKLVTFPSFYCKMVASYQKNGSLGEFCSLLVVD